jgi:mannosyltransferase OCH1-like enzyme
MSIPKIIHQTFKSWDTLPAALRENCQKIASLNKDHEYRFYGNDDCERFISEHYGDRILRIYNQIHPFFGAARADLFRYLCIYHYGGIYLDLKSHALRPFSEVLRQDDSYLLAQWQSNAPEDPKRKWGIYSILSSHGINAEFQNWHIAAEPRHPFLGAVISQVLNRILHYQPFEYKSSQEAIIHTTGPVAYTLAISPLLKKHPYRLVSTEKDLALSYSFYASDQEHRHFYPSYANRLLPLTRCNPIVSSLTYFHYQRNLIGQTPPLPHRLAIHLLRHGYNIKALMTRPWLRTTGLLP